MIRSDSDMLCTICRSEWVTFLRRVEEMACMKTISGTSQAAQSAQVDEPESGIATDPTVIHMYGRPIFERE